MRSSSPIISGVEPGERPSLISWRRKRRIVEFAAGYRRDLTVFVVLVVVAAFAAVLNSLIFKKIIIGHRHAPGRCVTRGRGVGRQAPAAGEPGQDRRRKPDAEGPRHHVSTGTGSGPTYSGSR
jgi:hypothetical protein